jgi:hypothetical protein
MSRIQIIRNQGDLVDWCGRRLEKNILRFIEKGNAVRVPLTVEKNGQFHDISPYFEIVRICKTQPKFVVGKIIGWYLDTEYMNVGEEKTFNRRDIVEIPLESWSKNCNLIRHVTYY